MSKFWVENHDDEQIELFVGEKSVGSFNHDTHGYSAMRDVQKLFENIANALGEKFEKT
ncbi:hypothetical protein ACRQ5Q_15290 [Bradyrhizobium sp. PMVTL-01]|uniref:hypothetical protein n=1 Tax=Bradyrhizobium sp. PMVTL-01 TaxID=3434999 RepID=UPI003F721ECE